MQHEEHETSYVFFFNDTATTEIYTLSLHDALPICWTAGARRCPITSASRASPRTAASRLSSRPTGRVTVLSRSEEHTSELQSRQYLVCRLLLEKKKNTSVSTTTPISFNMLTTRLQN